jgi:type IV pilus assembly protein PilE
MKRLSNVKLKAFTLTELMVVLVIIGILTLIALPVFDDLFADAYSVEAQNQLKYLQSRQKSYYQRHFKFAESLDDLGFTQPKTVQEDGDARYLYEIVNATQNAFTARATAIADFDNDGSINTWEINSEGQLMEVTPD